MCKAKFRETDIEICVGGNSFKRLHPSEARSAVTSLSGCHSSPEIAHQVNAWIFEN
jgi:hypothetical protein